MKKEEMGFEQVVERKQEFWNYFMLIYKIELIIAI